MMDRDAVATRLAREIGILRKLVIEFCVGRRHLARGERNAIGEADNALRHRAQVVRHVGAEGHGTEPAATFRLVLATPIVFEHELAALAHEQRVQAVDLAVLLEFKKALAEELG